MRRYQLVAGGALVATAIAVTACSSGDTASPSTTSTTAGSGTSGPPSGGPGGGGGPGGAGGGGVGQTFTAVALDSDGTSAGGANTAAVVPVVEAFLASLDETTRDTATYDFDDTQARTTWSNYPQSAVPREGVRLADLTEEQQQAALAVLTTALSGDGATQDAQIQEADDYLSSLGGQGSDGFGSLVDYSVAVYGTPSTTTPFAVQFGGHHLARNLTYNGDDVSQTPQFVGTEPTSFSADGGTVEPLQAESTALFGLFDGLTDDQRTGAEITSGTFDDLVMGPGVDDGVFPGTEGLSVADLDDAQQEQVVAAVQAYVGDLSTAAAQATMAQYTAELDQTTIGWSNNTGPTDESSYLRIDGPSVWIEFVNTRSQSTPDIHFHSVYRDKENDYGSSSARG